MSTFRKRSQCAIKAMSETPRLKNPTITYKLVEKSAYKNSDNGRCWWVYKHLKRLPE